MIRKTFLFLCVGLCLCGVTFAQIDEVAEGTGSAPGPSPITMGVPVLDGLLFVGTSNNSNSPTATYNDVFTVDPVSDTATSILSGVNTWGATADTANSRVLFTRSSGLTPPPGLIGGGDELFEVPYSGGTPTSLGQITDPATGYAFRIDGLAVSGGVLYGSHAGGTTNGLYEIDWSTLEINQVGSWTDSISGIDADPDTGQIYGVNDTIFALVTIDAAAGTNTFLASYPSGMTDIDGIAVGGGIAYLVTDEAGTIPVYDLVAGTYGTPLTSPFTTADVFSAAAIAVGGGGQDDGGSDDGGVPATTGVGIALLVLLLGGGGAYFLRRK